MADSGERIAMGCFIFKKFKKVVDNVVRMLYSIIVLQISTP